MFCSNCGASATGNFCAACGSRLAGVVPSAPLPEPPPTGDWHTEHRYEVLLKHAEVRERLARYAAQWKGSRISGEQLMELYDKTISPLKGISMSTVMKVALPIYERLGIHTSKTRAERIRKPCGTAIVSVLCSLARNGQPLKEVHQGDDGCVVEATLPSDVISLTAGQLLITLKRDGGRTHIDAATNLPGQLYDWGKSNRCLARLFDDVASMPD